MIGWLVSAGILGLLLWLKVGLRLKWESGEASLKVRIGRFRFALSTNKKVKNSKNSTRSNQKAANSEKKPDKPSAKRWVKALLLRWREVLQLISKILRSPQLDLLRLEITGGDRDPEKCAMQYGKLCASLSAGLPFVEQVLPIKKKQIQVQCNFDLWENEIYAEAEATVRIYEVLSIAVAGLLLLIRVYREVKTSEKAVDNQ